MRIALTALALLSGAAAAQEISLNRVASGLSAPTDIANAGDGSGRLFLVQQNGIIRILKNGALAPAPFLDIRGKTAPGGERGLLGLAFPPGFASKQRFYVNYTDLNGDTTVSAFRVSSDPDAAEPASETVLLKVQQPFSNHNGGCLRFGPDGYLYIGMGDGGSGGDPQGNGQNRASLLGKLLRLDVETEPGRALVPPSNPFAADPAARPEIWALGFRNPWRFSFDRATGDLWIADVGQDAWEEIDLEPAGSPGGRNYGWNVMEGAHCYRAGCSTAGLVQPVWEYSHDDGCSITGGYVYRGPAAPGLRGTYVYADYCSGRVWGLEKQGSAYTNRLLLASGMNIPAIGEDEAGELYIANAADGAVYRVEGSQAPRFSAAGVVNSASYAPGLVPGSRASRFVAGVKDAPGVVSSAGFPLPLELAGVSATLDGIPAPVLAVANQNGVEQVNIQAPYELRGRARAQAVVRRNGVASAPVAVAVLDAGPGVFTTDGTQAVAVHPADYTLVTAASPLRAGEVAFFYATGLGPAAGEPPTGAAAPLDPLSPIAGAAEVTLGGVSARIEFAGLAPTLAGVYQVNFRVPAGLPSGSQPLVLKVNGVAAAAVQAPVE